MRYVKLGLGIVLTVSMMAVFIVSPAAAQVAVGEKAPNFTLGNVSGSGNVKLSDYTTKPTLLVFWVSWCSHCQDEAPAVNQVYTDLKSKGVNIVGVSADEAISDAQGFVKEYKVTYPNAFAGTQSGMKVLQNYGIEGVPALYVIDKTGVVKAVFTGNTSADKIKAEFAKLGVK